MKKLFSIASLFIVAGLLSFTGDKSMQLPIPKGWSKPLYDFSANPLSEAKIALGRKLFHDPLLSRDKTISCSSCHLPQTSFTHIDHDLSHGIDGRIGKRNSPVLINLAWSRNFMWDGAVHQLDAQPLAPISNPDEMDDTLVNVLQKLRNASGYPALFEQAYGDTNITGERMLKALSAFMLTFISADSKYDKVMRKEPGAAFNEYEARGYGIFKAQCASCHTEPLFTNGAFENNGLAPDTFLNDKGRMSITGKTTDELKFKVPTLRNIELTYPYMHDGRYKNLQMVLFHYTNNIFESSTLSPKLRGGLQLSESDKRDLIAFLKTLTDESFTHNNAFFPEPPAAP